MSDSTTSTSGDVAAGGGPPHLNSAKEGAQDEAWAEFRRTRASLAEVMDDDELRDLGFELDVLDSRP